MALIRNTLRLIGTLIGDAIDEWTDGESRSALQDRLRTASERAAQLALEKASLEDKVDELRFNGPTLWSDEVDALNFAVNGCDSDTRAAIKRLLDRCDHMPVTAKQMESMAVEAITEVTGNVDPGVDIDEPYEGSWLEAADNEGAMIASRFGDDDE